MKTEDTNKKNDKRNNGIKEGSSIENGVGSLYKGLLKSPSIDLESESETIKLVGQNALSILCRAS